jgi:hypothetical protein
MGEDFGFLGDEIKKLVIFLCIRAHGLHKFRQHKLFSMWSEQTFSELVGRVGIEPTTN